MAISDIAEYCSAAGELAGSCNQTLGAARGLSVFLSFISENAFFIVVIAVFALILLWIMSQMTPR